MPKPMESSAQRRKLLSEIQRLAEVAVFGTLSETYRTCGRAGCHCQRGGPKHGPHLNISYHGEKGKTRATTFHKGQRKPRGKGVAAWQKLQACLRQLAELNKQRNLPCPRGQYAIKRWLIFLFAWTGVLCLFLSLAYQASMIHDPPSGVDRSLGLCRKTVSASSRALLATSTEFIRSRAGPLQSFPANYALLIAVDVGPPWLDYRGPRGARGRSWLSYKAASQAGSLVTRLPAKPAA